MRLAAEEEKVGGTHAREEMPGGARPDGPRGERERALAAAIGRLGVWDAGLCSAPAAVIRAAAVELEQAGYGAAWLHEAGRDAFVAAAILLAGTRRLVVGTSIVSLWRHEPVQMANAARTLGEAFPGRFVLGIGAGHEGAGSWHGRSYDRPLRDLAEYLDAVDTARYFAARPEAPVPRVIAALGPRALELARQRSRGAIPYLVPVAYTRTARATLGPEPVLAVHQAIVLGQRPQRARELAREHVGRYLAARNYRSNLLRCGFTERDLRGLGSERLIDALVATGGIDEAAARVRTPGRWRRPRLRQPDRRPVGRGSGRPAGRAGRAAAARANNDPRWVGSGPSIGSSPDAGQHVATPDWPRSRIHPLWEAVMTEPQDTPQQPLAEATAADAEAEVNPVVIKDLDVTGDDADNVAGGCSWTRVTGNPQ